MSPAAGPDLGIAAAVRQAEERVRPYLRRTPLERSVALEQASGVRAWVKLENLQHTGSFKARGALSALLALDPSERDRGVVTASTGNHGAAAAYAARQLGCRVTVFVPETASPTKVAAIERYGTEVRAHGGDGIEAELRAREVAAEEGLIYLSPYNDLSVVGGQGTVAVELEEQLTDFDGIFVAVGGGGLISGIAGYLSEVRPDVRVVGCSPENSAVMDASVRAGRILDLESLPTLSDGTAGGVEEGTITFEPCRLLVDDWVQVSEAEIAAAMLEFMEAHHMMIEGSAAVAMAAYQKRARELGLERCVIVSCGANISLRKLAQVINERESR